MTRTLLLTTSLATAILTLGSTGFAAAIVQKGAPAIGAGVASKLIQWRDADRYVDAHPTTLFSLATMNAESFLTLTGLCLIAPGSEAAFLHQSENMRAEGRFLVISAPDFQSTDTENSTTASDSTAAEKLGPASAFAATAQVPEPSAMILAAMGVVAFLRRRA